MPKISVLMSVYNGELFLRQAVESILQQSFRDFEFIIVNDGSTDSSPEILRSFDDGRIQLVNQPNMGLTKSLNKAMKMARGEYIARQDADDVSEPDRFRKQVEALDGDTEVVLVSSLLKYISATGEGRTITNRDFSPLLVKWLLLFFNHVGGHSQVMYRREDALQLGGYNESYKYSQDYDLWLRFAAVGKILVLPEVLLNWRYHANNISVVSAQDQQGFSLATSKKFVEKYAGCFISTEEISLMRNFWIKKETSFSSSDFLHINSICRRVLSGLKKNQHVSNHDAKEISSLIAKFFLLNEQYVPDGIGVKVARLLSYKWRFHSSFTKNARVESQTEKIR